MSILPETSRGAFLQALDKYVDVVRADSSTLGLLLIDLTNLASINHYHGYGAGDLLLEQTLQKLLEVSKLPDTVYRVGDHRFAFILPSLINPAFITLALNRVNNILEQELLLDTGLVLPDFRVGVAINQNGERDALSMLALAESSLARVKQGESLRIEALVSGSDEQEVDYQLEHRFLRAIQGNDFELYYQPKVDLATGRATRAEALLRWMPEGRPPVSPELVVELAEGSGQSYDLAKWTVHVALRQLREWQDVLDLGLAINIQAGLVGNADLPALFHDAIRIWGIDPGNVTVEITESALMEDKGSGFDNLGRLKELGLKLSIDDFGTGYSSLSYFKQIPAAELKIDRSFVSSMMSDSQDLELVKIIIHIAHQFGMSVVAEGVEDEASLDVLRELGCDFAQGYYFSEALPAAEFEAWVRNWPGVPPR